MRKKNWSNCTTLAGAKLGVPALEPGQGTKGKSWVKFELFQVSLSYSSWLLKNKNGCRNYKLEK